MIQTSKQVNIKEVFQWGHSLCWGNLWPTSLAKNIQLWRDHYVSSLTTYIIYWEVITECKGMCIHPCLLFFDDNVTVFLTRWPRAFSLRLEMRCCHWQWTQFAHFNAYFPSVFTSFYVIHDSYITFWRSCRWISAIHWLNIACVMSAFEDQQNEHNSNHSCPK